MFPLLFFCLFWFMLGKVRRLVLEHVNSRVLPLPGCRNSLASLKERGNDTIRQYNHQTRALFNHPNPMAVSARSLSRSSSRQDIKSTKPSPTQSSKPADYVYFDRTTTSFSDEAVPRAKAAQLKLEHYYKVAVDAAIERNTRYSPLPCSFMSFITDNRLQGASNSRGDCKRTQ